jgi:Leucine-rich repeat (LRR) protein
MQCPEGCSCYHDNSWTNNVIQCSAGDFNDVPPLIPMDATTVYLDGNNMTELVNPGFIGRKRVHTIYLNNSLIQHVTNFSFEGLSSLRVLHLENNRIERLEGTEFGGLDRMKELYLQNNLLAYIAPDTFENLRSLAVLRLDGNLLVNFPVWELSKNSLLVSISLVTAYLHH